MGIFCKLGHSWSVFTSTKLLKIGKITITKRKCTRCNRTEHRCLETGDWLEVKGKKFLG